MADSTLEEAAASGAAASELEPASGHEPETLEPAPAAPPAPGAETPDGSGPDAASASEPAPASERASADPDGTAPRTRADALLAAVERLEEQVSAQTGRILQTFNDKFAFDGFKETQVERLHAELQQHREGMLERATRPLLNAVIRVHDDLGKVVASLAARPPEEITPERTFRVLEGFREDLELLLAQHGVEPFEPVDDVFDPRLHTALRTVHTGDPERAGRIAQRLRPGFSHGEALLQKARVAVFTAQGAPAPAAQPAAPTQTTATGDQG
jgi:molecular chaperone GrpE